MATNESGLDTARRLLQLSALPLDGLLFAVREVRNAPRCAYNVLVKMPGQKRGRALFTIIRWGD